VRVVAGDIGGSFGMKTPVANEYVLALLAAKLIGRPVKWISTRSEAFLSDGQARDNVTDAEMALDHDGNFLGVRVKTIANTGAYLQFGSTSFIGNIGTVAGVYRTPALHTGHHVRLHQHQSGATYRGNGRPEAAFIIERLVDLAADQLVLIRWNCAAAIRFRPMPCRTRPG